MKFNAPAARGRSRSLKRNSSAGRKGIIVIGRSRNKAVGRGIEVEMCMWFQGKALRAGVWRRLTPSKESRGIGGTPMSAPRTGVRLIGS